MERMTSKLLYNSACRECVGDIGEAVVQEELFFNDVEAVMVFT